MELNGLLAAAFLLRAGAALAADPAVVCESSKLKISSSYSACLLKATAKAVKKGISPDFTKCDDRFQTRFPVTETKAGPMVCPSEADVAGIGQRITGDVAIIATLLAGDLPVECGNGVTDGDDQCDGSDLDGQTCRGLGFTLGGTLTCTAGCGFDTSGCVTEKLPATGQLLFTFGAGDDGQVRAGALRTYLDNHDGTISDANTGLMWEKKRGRSVTTNDCSATEAGACADPHDADNVYTWTSGSQSYNGSVVTIFLNQLNNRCNSDTTVSCTVDADCAATGGACGFAGHRDWRLPNVNELLGIVDRGTYNPAVDSAFHGVGCGTCGDLTDASCSCDAQSHYWSSTTAAFAMDSAWRVRTDVGFMDARFKTSAFFARAVRGGL